MKEGTDKIDGLIAEIDDNTMDLRYDIETTIEDLDRLDKQKDQRLKHVIPGDRIKDLLKKMDNVETVTN